MKAPQVKREGGERGEEGEGERERERERERDGGEGGERSYVVKRSVDHCRI